MDDRRILLSVFSTLKHISSKQIEKVRGLFYSGKKNVKIGKGAVISGSVNFKEGVTINDYGVAFGMPAKVKYFRGYPHEE